MRGCASTVGFATVKFSQTLKITGSRTDDRLPPNPSFHRTCAKSRAGPVNSNVGQLMRIFLVSFFCLLSLNAAACSCAFAPLNNGTVRNANDIFVFQLISATIEPETSNPLVTRKVVGEIRIVDVLRGEPRVRSMRYTSSFCCGTRMYVGQYYVAFISSKELEFSGNTGNLLNLGDLTLN